MMIAQRIGQPEPKPAPRPARELPLPPELSIVVPARDEEHRIGALLLRLARVLEARAGSAEVIVVDDGSRDATASVAEGHAELFDALRVVRLLGPTGKGAALRTGWLAARGALVLTTDVGMPTPFDALPRMNALIRRGADIVIGTRVGSGSKSRTLGSGLAKAASRGFAIIAATLVPTGIRDTQSGFKLLRGSIARELARMSEIDGRSFDVEVLGLARQLGLRIAELDVPSVARRLPTWRELLQVPHTIADLLRIRRRMARQRTVRMPDLGDLRGT